MRAHVTVTPAEVTAIQRGQSAIAAAQQYLQSDLQSIGQPVPDYGNAPGCTPNGCVAVLK
jgi:hypothetical protein